MRRLTLAHQLDSFLLILECQLVLTHLLVFFILCSVYIVICCLPLGNYTDIDVCTCPEFNYTGGRCQPGTYCPSGSAAPVQCTPGEYCMDYELATPNGKQLQNLTYI